MLHDFEPNWSEKILVDFLGFLAYADLSSFSKVKNNFNQTSNWVDYHLNGVYEKISEKILVDFLGFLAYADLSSFSKVKSNFNQTSKLSW